MEKGICKLTGEKGTFRGSAGLLNGKAPGTPSILDDSRRQALRQVVESGPIPAAHGVVRWRLIDLARWLMEEFRVSISKQTLSRELRNMGFRKLSARPRHHAKDEETAAEKLPRHRGENCRTAGSWQTDRDLVPR